MWREERDYIIGVEPPPSLPPSLVPGVVAGLVAGVGVVAGLLVTGNDGWNVPPKLLGRSLTCSTTRLITLRGGAAGIAEGAFMAGALRRAAFLAPTFAPAAERRGDVGLERRGVGRLDAFLEAFADFFAPPLRAAEAFFELAFRAGAFLEDAFFADGRAFREVFFAGFLDALFFEDFLVAFFAGFFEVFFAAFFEDLRDELFLDAAMLCLLLNGRFRVRTGSGDHAAWQLGCTKSI